MPPIMLSLPPELKKEEMMPMTMPGRTKSIRPPSARLPQEASGAAGPPTGPYRLPE